MNKPVNKCRRISTLKISLFLISLFFHAPVLFSQQQLPEFLLQNGNSSSVDSVSFSPDGRLLASGSSDNSVKVWKVKTGEVIKTLKGHSDDVTSVAFSSDGFHLVSNSEDNTIKLWEVKSGKLIKTLKEHSFDVESVSLSPDGNLLASGSLDKAVKYGR